MQPVSGAPRRGSLSSIQAMRAVAALVVAAFHTSVIMAKPDYGGRHVFTALVGKGWLGVNFFFVLSGFIILHAHTRDIGRPDRLARYVWRRVTRVYPLYWLLLTAYIAAALHGFGAINFRVAFGDLFSAYTLVQWVGAPSLPLRVAWTLFYEVEFYALFALLIASRRLGAAAFAAWLTAILVNTLALGRHEMGWANMWSVNFYFGALALPLYRRMDARWGWPLLVAGVGLLAAMLELGLARSEPGLQQHAPVALLLLGLPFTLILLGGVLMERRGGWPDWRAVTLLGDASYAVYLVHSAVISALCGFNRRHAFGLPDAATFLLLFAASVAVGVGVHLLVERPLLRGARALAAFRLPSGRLAAERLAQDAR